MTARAQDGASARISFHIPAGTLVEVLARVSRQAGVQVVTSAPPSLRTARPLDGRFGVEEAIRRVTRGLPVTVRRLAGNYIVTPAAQASALPSSPQARPAPDLPPEASDEPIVVTGYRESLRQAVAVKRAARGIVEVTRAEDIAAFPDHNAADALQRLPGVTVSRDNGEGRQVSVRGLGPLFTRTTLNGMEALATTASGMDSRGSVSRQRRFDYSVFDAGLFSGIEVRKTWSAQDDAGGVGGTVALHTLRPFDRPGNVSLLSLQAVSGGKADGLSPKITGEFSRRSGTWGVLVAGSFSHNRITEYGYRNWDWVPVRFGEGNIGPGVAAADRRRLTGEGAPVYMARGQSYSTWNNRFDRLNLVGSIEHQGDDGLHLTLDLVHARLANDRSEYSLAAAGTNGLTTGTIEGTQVLQAVRIAQDTMTSAAFSGIDMRTESKVTRDHTDFDQAVLSLERPLGNSTTLLMRAGYARSDFRAPVFDKVFLQSTGRDFAYVATGSAPRNVYGFPVVDPADWTLMRADVREDAIVNDNATARFEVARRVSPHVEVRLGGSYRYFGNRGYERRVSRDYDEAPAAIAGNLNGRSLAPYVVADVDATFAATGQARVLAGDADLPGTAYRVRENSYAAFAVTRFDFAMGTVPVAVEAGVQYRRTVTASIGDVSGGTQQAGATSIGSTGGRSGHGAWLPSLQMRLALRADRRLRFAFSRNVNQPDVADLRAAAEVDSTPFGGTVETGNPALRPFTSTAFDLAVEQDLGRDGYAALGMFYKHMGGFITTETTVMRYADTGLPLAFLYEGRDGSALYNVLRPFNGPGAAIAGAEATIQRDLRFLPAPFDGLGIQTNVTFASGSGDVVYGGTALRLPLIDLSRWSGNATLYYTGTGWDARIAAACRGRYRTGPGNNGNIGQWIAATTTLDFAAHATLAGRLQASFEARNLTDAPIVQYTDRTARRLLARTRSGRIFALGLRYAY